MAFVRADRLALDTVVAGNVCAACGGNLDVATHEGAYALRCGHCNAYGPDTRPRYEPGLVQRYRQHGIDDLNAIERMQLANLLHKRVNRAESNGETPDPRLVAMVERLEGEMGNQGRDLTVRQPAAIMTKEDAGRFLDLADLKMSAKQREMAVALMEATGLSPALQEIMIYENKIYVQVDGFRKIMNKSGLFDGMERPRYLSAGEKAAQGYAEDDVVCEVALYRKGRKLPFYGTGKANPNRPYRNNLVEKAHPQRFAENRGFRQAARLGFYDLLSGYAGLVELEPDEELRPEAFGDFIEGAATEVDPDTGEILTPPAGTGEETEDAARKRLDGELAAWFNASERDRPSVRAAIQSKMGRGWGDLSAAERSVALEWLRSDHGKQEPVEARTGEFSF